MNYRSYKTDKEYKAFRELVRKRDKYVCMWPDCDCRIKMNVHHILPWKQFPQLRYDVNNGILLCRKHHNEVTGHELAYASFLKGLINN